MSSIKREIGHFHVEVVQKRAKKCTKKAWRAKLLFCYKNLLFFFWRSRCRPRLWILKSLMTRVHARRPLFGTTAATATIKKWIRASSCPNSGSKGGAVVRALVSHQCGPGSTPDVDAIFGLSLLLVLSLAPRGFSPGSPVFPSPQKLTLPNSNSIWNARTRFSEFIWTPMCLVGKQAIYNFCFTIFITIIPSRLLCQMFSCPGPVLDKTWI